MQENLKYYDGYFYHHITIYTQKAKDVFGRELGTFNAYIHKSGNLPETLRVGPKTAQNQKDANGWRCDSRPLASFKTEQEALDAAKLVCDQTTGQYCKDYYYRR